MPSPDQPDIGICSLNLNQTSNFSRTGHNRGEHEAVHSLGSAVRGLPQGREGPRGAGQGHLYISLFISLSAYLHAFYGQFVLVIFGASI